MKQIRLIMGMPITLEVSDEEATEQMFSDVYAYFDRVDKKFSTYKPESEISKINRGEVLPENASDEMKEVFSLSERTKLETNGYFDIFHNGKYDPSGLVKGWAINNAAEILKKRGIKNFYIDAGGDIQVSGFNSEGAAWNIGIKNPFNQEEIIKVVYLTTQGIATSGNYIRGEHIYNPKSPGELNDELVSITVLGPNIYEADRFATPAFAMGKEGLNFIQTLPGFEAYAVFKDRTSIFTEGFEAYTKKL